MNLDTYYENITNEYLERKYTCTNCDNFASGALCEECINEKLEQFSKPKAVYICKQALINPEFEDIDASEALSEIYDIDIETSTALLEHLEAEGLIETTNDGNEITATPTQEGENIIKYRKFKLF